MSDIIGSGFDIQRCVRQALRQLPSSDRNRLPCRSPANCRFGRHSRTAFVGGRHAPATQLARAFGSNGAMPALWLLAAWAAGSSCRVLQVYGHVAVAGMQPVSGRPKSIFLVVALLVSPGG